MDVAALAGSVPDAVAALGEWVLGTNDEPLVVETSGSSGAPKRVVLSRSAVAASAEASARRVGGRGPWVLALPPGFVAGVNVICRSWLAGHEPVTEWPPVDESGWFTSLVPTQLLRMLDDPDAAETLTRAHTVLLGGGPLDPALRERAERSGVRVVATYGSAETCGGCVYDGVPLDGVGVALDAEGRVRLAGPTLFDGYEGDADLTSRSLVDGWFVTADAGRFDDDGRLQVLGRVDDVVVTGGVNVPGSAVAARLREHPDVVAAEVLGVADEEWGHRLVAFVVVAAGSDHGPDLEQLRDWVGQVHPRSWAPREVVALDELPMLPNGKPDRLRMRALVGD